VSARMCVTQAPSIESTRMCSWLRRIAKWLVPLCAALLVGVALCRAQYPGELVDVGPLLYPHDFSHTSEHGWPAFWVLRNEYGDVFAPNLAEVHYTVLPWNLAADLAAWIAVVIATARVSWRMCSSRGRFSLRSLFSLTTTVAILLAWWRVECACCIIRGNPALTALARMDAETPMLRMLQFPPSVCIPLLFSIACLILCAIDMTFYIATRLATCLARRGNRE